MEKEWFEKIENVFSKFLYDHAEIMPISFVKMIAFYHPDPYLRKICWKRLGVIMGENTLTNLGMQVTRISGKVSVILGNNVSVAPGVTFVASSCPNNGKEIAEIAYVKDYLIKEETIIVEDEAWIGVNAIIMPGITIGRCSIIGAGSFVNQDVEPYAIYAGSPAQCIRKLTDEECI